MNQEFLLALGDRVGYENVLSAAKSINPVGGYLEKFVSTNSVDGPCVGKEGQCGECRDGVWFPCTEEEPEN